MKTRAEQVLDFLTEHREDRMVKLITGLRGCGKSYAVGLWIDRLLASGVRRDRIIRCDFEDPHNRHLLDPENLLAWIDSRTPSGDDPVYVILDEVCRCFDFESVVGVLYARSAVRLVMTCSNRRAISENFRKYIAGHGARMVMVTPSFAEVEVPEGGGFEARLRHVLRYGTLPYLFRYANYPELSEVVRVYHTGLWNTILVKDILTRNRLADSRLVEKLLERIYEHLGENESLRKIAAGSTIDGCDAAPNTVESYISALDESYLVKRVRKFDVFEGEVVKSGFRFYLGDLALGANRYGDFSGDPSNAIRNLISLELVGRGYEVYGGRYDGSDFDFVTVRNSVCTCWQYVPALVEDAVPTAYLAALKRVPANVQRVVITRGALPKRRTKGLEYITLQEFLMSTDRGKMV